MLEALNLEMVTQYRQAREQLPPVTAEEQAVLDGLSQTPAHIDEIAQRCSLPVSTISGALVTLELKGIIRQVGVMTYVRT